MKTLPFASSSNPPVWNAAGTLGFAPGRRGPVQTDRLGAFVTNPISWQPRAPAQPPRRVRYPGGVLLHTGLPNPGFRQTLRLHAKKWARAPVPVIVHLIADDPENIRKMVLRLEEVEGVAAIELGLPPDARPSQIVEWTQAAAGELPLIVQLPLNAAPFPDGGWPEPLPAAVSLGPPRGALPGRLPDGRVEGRLYGPALFPMALQAVSVGGRGDLPVVAAGGVFQPDQASVLLAAGAAAVQLDLRLWRNPWPDADWQAWLASFSGD